MRLFGECLRRLGVSPAEAIYIGNDTQRDVKGANDAGMKSVLIMTRYGSKDVSVAKPHYTISRMDELFRRAGGAGVAWRASRSGKEG